MAWVLFVYVGTSTAAQQPALDSLLLILKELPTTTDTAKLHRQMQINRHISNIYSTQKEYGKSRLYARAALRLATQTHARARP